jgi:hypothetical protein
MMIHHEKQEHHVPIQIYRFIVLQRATRFGHLLLPSSVGRSLKDVLHILLCFNVLCNISFKKHLPEDGYNRWPKQVAGHAVYTAISYISVYASVGLISHDNIKSVSCKMEKKQLNIP